MAQPMVVEQVKRFGAGGNDDSVFPRMCDTGGSDCGRDGGGAIRVATEGGGGETSRLDGRAAVDVAFTFVDRLGTEGAFALSSCAGREGRECAGHSGGRASRLASHAGRVPDRSSLFAAPNLADRGDFAPGNLRARSGSAIRAARDWNYKETQAAAAGVAGGWKPDKRHMRRAGNGGLLPSEGNSAGG